jgi:hypothetical protein
MAHRNERADIVTEIVTLREQQFQSEIDATYLGWTLKAKVAKQRRTDLISLLVGALDDLNTSDALNNEPPRAAH